MREAEVVPEPPKPRPKPKKRPPQPKTSPKEPPPVVDEPPPDAPVADEAPPPLMGFSMEGVATAPSGGMAVPVRRDGHERGKRGGTGTKPSAPVADVPVPVAGVSSMPTLTFKARPDFPEELQREGIEGRVVVNVLVGADGRVKEAKVVQRLHPLLDANAVRAAKRCRLEPALVDGRPVAVRIPLTFYFVVE